MFDLIEVVKFIIFQIFAVIIPGMGVLSLIKLKKIDKLIYFTFSYGLGVLINIIEYYILSYLEKYEYINILIIVIAIISIFIIFRNRKYSILLKMDKGILAIILVFSIVVSVITFICFTMNNISPELLNSNSYYQDILWNIGNVESIVQGFPITDLRLGGYLFKYHYLMHIHLAVMSSFTKIEIYKIYTVFAFGVQNIFLVFSMGILLNRITQKKWLVFLGLSIMFITVAPYEFLVPFLNHLYVSPFGLALALAFATLCIYSFFNVIDSQDVEWRIWFVLSIIFFIGTLGAKGPIAAVLLCGVIATCIWSITKNKKKYLSICIIFLCVFVIFYFIIFLGGEQKIWIELFHVPKNSIFGAELLTKLQSMELNGILCSFIVFIMHFVFSQPIINISFIVSIVLMIINYKKINSKIVCLFIIGLAGITATNLFAHSGFSELYFIFAAIPFIVCFIIYTLEITKLMDKSKLIKGVIAVLLLFSVVSFLKGFTYNISRGIQQYDRINENGEIPEPTWNSITKYEYDGMIWLKENTTFDDIIITDRQYIDPNKGEKSSRYFYYSAFSGRKIYLEGYDYIGLATQENSVIKERENIIKGVYDNDISSIELAKRDNVSYVIVSRLIHNDIQLSEQFFEKVYSNRDIEVFKIL